MSISCPAKFLEAQARTRPTQRCKTVTNVGAHGCNGEGEFFDGARAKNNVFMNHNKTVHRFGTTATQNISRNVSNPINGRAERSSNRAKGRAPRGLCGTGGSGKRLCPVVYDRQYIGANHAWFLCDEDRIPVSHTDWMII